MFYRPAWIVHRTKLSLLIIFLIYTVLTVTAMAEVDQTADESKYLSVGQVILDTGWDHELTRQHPPLAYYCNQIFSPFFAEEWLLRQEMTSETMFWGRLGLLPFGWLAATLVFLLARGVYGTNAGLFALCCFALNPLMVGYSALLVVDMAYLAGTLLAVHQLWRYLLRPGTGRGVALGLAIGFALTTKYLTLLIVPVLLLSAAARTRHARYGLATFAGVGVIALLTLHASYGFGGGMAPLDPGSYQSTLVISMVQLPGIGSLLALFPEPFMLGVDFQLAVNDGWGMTFLNGRFADRHWDYNLWCFLLKTPEWTILLGSWLLLRKLPGWLRGKGSEKERALAWACIPSALVLIIYLSLFAEIQIGMRYMLPLYGMLFILLGASLREPWLRKLSPRHLAILGIVWLGLQSYDLANQWPNLIAYYNTTSGGQAEGYRHFRDSNSEWGQLRAKGRRMLQESEGEDLAFIGPGQGPRFGRIAIYLSSLVSEDHEDSTRTRHWLDAFEPVQHVGAAWWVFDCRPEDWEAVPTLATEQRVRADLVVAYLGDGRLDQAGRHLLLLSQDRAAPLRVLLDQLRRAQNSEPNEQQILTIAKTWYALARFDLVVELLRGSKIPGISALLAQSLANSGRVQQAIAVLQASPSMSTTEALILASLYRRIRRYSATIELLEQRMTDFTVAERGMAEQLLTSVRSRREFRELIR